MRWIKIDSEDKSTLPDYNDPVFLTRDDCVFVGVRSETNITGEHYMVFSHPKHPKSSYPQDAGDKITHWMPMEFPELPK